MGEWVGGRGQAGGVSTNTRFRNLSLPGKEHKYKYLYIRFLDVFPPSNQNISFVGLNHSAISGLNLEQQRCNCAKTWELCIENQNKIVYRESNANCCVCVCVCLWLLGSGYAGTTPRKGRLGKFRVPVPTRQEQTDTELLDLTEEPQTSVQIFPELFTTSSSSSSEETHVSADAHTTDTRVPPDSNSDLCRPVMDVFHEHKVAVLKAAISKHR